MEIPSRSRGVAEWRLCGESRAPDEGHPARPNRYEITFHSWPPSIGIREKLATTLTHTPVYANSSTVSISPKRTSNNAVIIKMSHRPCLPPTPPQLSVALPRSPHPKHNKLHLGKWVSEPSYPVPDIHLNDFSRSCLAATRPLTGQIARTRNPVCRFVILWTP